MDRLTLGHICLEFIVCKLYTEKGVGTRYYINERVLITQRILSYCEFCIYTHPVNSKFTILCSVITCSIKNITVFDHFHLYCIVS